MSILVLDRCLGVCRCMLGSSPRQLLFQALIFLPFDRRGSGRQENQQPRVVLRSGRLSKGWNPSSVGWLLGEPAWPSSPGRGNRPTSSEPLVRSLCPAQQCFVGSRYIQEELGPLGRNQQSFRKLGEEKAMSGYLGFGSQPELPPASQPCPPNWLCRHTSNSHRGSTEAAATAAILETWLVSDLPGGESLL